MGKNWAISVGINNYEFSQNLNYAKRDAKLMRDFLFQKAGFEEVLFFSDDSPDYEGKSTRPYFTNLRRVLRSRFDQPFMQAGDNFWFFFSGHGMCHDGCDYLMACDSDPGDLEHTAISIDFLTKRLRRCGADNVIMILDACRNQGSKSGEGIGNQAARVAREKGVITIFSCSPDQYSFEIDDLQQGVFTKALLEGLGDREQCATVKRLHDYLDRRVPDLIQQYKKSNTLRQTPYVIAEPDTKYHLIIRPQYATPDDIKPLKYDALQAEVNKDFDVAEQLWIRVLAASPRDNDAIKAIKRIAVAQLQLETNRSPIEPDVPLKSERGVDYTKLRELLAAGKWQEADEETANKMLEAAERTKEGWLRREDIDLFPCEDLRTIDQLWVKYSNGSFGFSVQKRIYQSLAGTREYNEKMWDAFGDRVGWRVNGKWLHYKDLKFNTKAYQGHLPVAVRRHRLVRLVRGVRGGLWSGGVVAGRAGGSLLSHRDL